MAISNFPASIVEGFGIMRIEVLQSIANIVYDYFPNQRRRICYAILTVGMLELLAGIPIALYLGGIDRGGGSAVVFFFTGLPAVLVGIWLQKLLNDERKRTRTKESP